MKLKDLKRCIGGLFPDVFRPVLDGCHNLPEIEVAIRAFQAADKELRRIELEYQKRYEEHLFQLAGMDAKVSHLEAQVSVKLGGGNVRVWLEQVEDGCNKISLLKALRDVDANLSLKDAKDIVDRCSEQKVRYKVFQGPQLKAYAAAKQINDAGGKTSYENI